MIRKAFNYHVMFIRLSNLISANGYASPYHYSPYYYEEDEYEGEDDYCPPCNCDEEKEDEDEGHYDKVNRNSFFCSRKLHGL